MWLGVKWDEVRVVWWSLCAVYYLVVGEYQVLVSHNACSGITASRSYTHMKTWIRPQVVLPDIELKEAYQNKSHA